MPSMKTRNVFCTLPVKQVNWLNKTAKDLNINRNQLLTMLFDGLMTTEQESDKPDTLFKLYTTHLENLLEASAVKKSK
jgi:hypothetical protein